jgi:ABC-2 type transport system permease protein
VGLRGRCGAAWPDGGRDRADHRDVLHSGAHPASAGDADHGILGATIFSLAGFINAVYAKKFDDVAIVPTFILTPLTYLGGVFYSVELLPPWAEAATHANPIFYMVNAFRYGLLGSSDVPVVVAYALMIGFVVVLTALALWLLRRGVGMRS